MKNTVQSPLYNINQTCVYYYKFSIFLQKLLQFNPHKRISARNALNHSYFRDEIDSLRTSSSMSVSESDSGLDTSSRSDTPVSK